PDDQALLNKRLQWQITDESRGLRYVKIDPRDTHLLSQIYILAADLYAMTHGLGIEKQHWGRYQIVRTKSYQHQHYGICGTGKHEIEEYGMDE
ncbi:hypothetical protein, partial [uncultured Nostoc sp.]|uniref:hypothetical protein n=1 Tax=uncultured Nostoc sp. TaxID=340711 RepID=UPI0035CA0D5E